MSSPYPQLAIDGYELEVVEQADSPDHPFLPAPIPDDAARFAVQPSDLVKLIFRYREPMEKNGHTITAEHMWVKVTEVGSACLVGLLDNDPQYTEVLKADDVIHFHPKHVVKIWEE